MPAQKNVIADLNRAEEITNKNVQMLITMHTGLTEIAKCPETPAGSEAMKYIAKKTIAQVNRIAATMEVAHV